MPEGHRVEEGRDRGEALPGLVPAVVEEVARFCGHGKILPLDGRLNGALRRFRPVGTGTGELLADPPVRGVAVPRAAVQSGVSRIRPAPTGKGTWQVMS
ncbi:hypothetical protein GCM10009760_57640 [Kitasatospora kazusensis]|uniref:Uncharacterized protein n=1 Tax=Kitasatospora kazusensis TaxID=407974 RepID=A0ABN3AA85_9ACTN